MFEIRERDGLARIGLLETGHGRVATPTLAPVVNPNRPIIPPGDLATRFGAQILITNAYILGKSPARDSIVRDGIHAFLGFPGAVMTDSGAFQSHVYGDVDVTNAEVVGFQKAIRTDFGTMLDVFSEPDHDSTRAAKDVFHWIVDFPLFEQDEESGGWTFAHHPFTAPMPGEELWDESNPVGVRGQHYDLVWNGWELGSGSIRIHQAELQQAVFRVMGMGEEEQRDKFGFLLDALQMGAPPHGGFAMGIDRFIALLAREPDIRQVTAFPKIASGADPLTGAPTPYPDSALKELGIRLLDPQPE